MKWYKKQMDKLKKTEVIKTDKETDLKKKTSGHQFNERQSWASPSFRRSPVAASKLQRDKTDVH